MRLKQVLPLGILACAILSACQPSPNNQVSAASQAKQNTQPNQNNQKVLRVSSELSKFPVVMHDGKGNVSGFEAELLLAVAQKQGFRVEWNLDSWAGLLEKLGTPHTDMLLGSVTITEERKQKMDFTAPVLAYKTGLMVQPAFADAKQFSDLRGKRVNLRKNTVYEELVPIFSVGDGKNMVYPNNVWQQVKSLLDNQSDAMVGASITLEYYQQQYADKKFHIIYEPNAKVSNYGWAVKKGNTELLNLLNEGLEKAKADGTYNNLYKKYWPNSKLPT